MFKRALHVNCSICNEIYNFGVFNKATLEVKRIYDNGSFCHSCFSEFCVECMKAPDIGIKHSMYDDEKLCKFEKCKLKGLLNCMMCNPQTFYKDESGDGEESKEESKECPPSPTSDVSDVIDNLPFSTIETEINKLDGGASTFKLDVLE